MIPAARVTINEHKLNKIDPILYRCFLTKIIHTQPFSYVPRVQLMSATLFIHFLYLELAKQRCQRAVPSCHQTN